MSMMKSTAKIDDHGFNRDPIASSHRMCTLSIHLN